MNYFKILGILFGLIALLKPFYMHILPWDENKFIAKTYTKKRPKWVIPVAITGLLIVAFTWYMEFLTNIQYSIIITIMFSLTAIKALILIIDYDQFHQWVRELLKKDKGKQIIIIDSFAGLFGLVLIILSLIYL